MLNNLKILCVEDDNFALEEMVSFLKKRAGKVFSANNGIEGLAQCEVHKPDIVIADLLMPEMDGMEMLRILKEHQPDIRAIVVSSVNSLDIVLETMDMGVDNYIIKPVEFAELELKLNKIAEAIAVERKTVKGRFDTLENRRALEDMIKKEFIKSLKSYLGKGPKEITVHLLGNEVKITVIGTLTVMEENLIKDMKNYQMVRQLRYSAYEAVTKLFESVLSEYLNSDMHLDKIEVDLRKKIDHVVFTVSKG